MMGIHTVWRRYDGAIEFNSRNMPAGVGFADQTNGLKQETLTLRENCWKGLRQKFAGKGSNRSLLEREIRSKLQLEVDKMHTGTMNTR
jgi:hypothetical protein